MAENGIKSLININPRRVRNRRIKIFGLMIVSTIIATIKWIISLPTDSSLFVKMLMVVLFVLAFAWIALFFWSSIFGFIELFAGRKSSLFAVN